MSTPVTIRVNGRAVAVSSGRILTTCLEQLGYDLRLVAVEFNGEILHRQYWRHTRIREGDVLEVVTIVGGGLLQAGGAELGRDSPPSARGEGQYTMRSVLEQRMKMKTPGTWRRRLAAVLLPVLMVGLMVFSLPQSADAARGGRLGGGSFAPRSLPRAGGRSFGGGSRGGSFGGGGFGFPFIIPFFGFGGGGLFGMLMLFAVVGLLLNGFRSAMGSGGTMGSANNALAERDGPVTIAQVQIGLLASARQLQQDLRQLAATANTGTATGLQRLLQDVTLALLRNPEYWVYGNGEAGQVGFPVAEATFNRLSMTERSKLDAETTINVAGQRSHGDAGQHSNASEYIAATLLVASRSPVRLPKVATTNDLNTALRLLGSIPSGDLLSLEVIWQPDGSGDVLSSTELVTLYPELQAL